ncbi:ABC transporter permease [Anaerosolibacter sp.]|uniref:ABC transporter permease n=1 Tax=Anaerosolibacter sp. TaxID=1872527 RepID=UPI0039F08BDD
MIRTGRIFRNINGWSLLSMIFIILIILPNFQILGGIFKESNENWLHIKEYLLKDYMINSMILITITGIFTVIIGVSLAWVISVYDFPLRNFLKWALVLPLAIPPYIAAYTYNGILGYTGAIQSYLRNLMHIQVNQKYFDIMSMEGAIFIFTFFLFPYVYIITRSFLEKQSSSLIENARLLGRNSFEIFLFVIFPLSRGAIIGGGSLVILEVLNDYGVVQYFAIPTFSTAIFKTWFGMGDLDSAVKLSSMLMVIIFLIMFLEKMARGRKRFSFTTTKVKPIMRQKLKGYQGILVCSYSLMIFSIGFIIPTIQLLQWSLLTYKKILNYKFIDLIFNSLWITFISSGFIIIVAIIIANYCRINDSWISRIYSKITILGYSIPGAVIAIGAIVFFINLDYKMGWLYKLIIPQSGRLVLSTSIIMLIFAYVIRFLAIGYNSIDSGFSKIGLRFHEASRTLGMGITETFIKVDLKMVKSAILGGFILVYVDILKELPLTLLLRPFNFNTLATKAYQYANDEMIQEAAIASIIIIIISALSIYLFYRVVDKEVK